MHHLNEDINYDDKDVLVITKPNAVTNNLDEDAQTNILLHNNQRAIKQAIYNGAYDDEDAEKIHINIKSSGDMAVITGFQSPFDSERSIVSLTATTNKAFTLLDNALMNSET